MCTTMSQSYIDIPLGHTKELTFNISEKPKQNKNDKTSKKEKSTTTSENQVRTKIKVKRTNEKSLPSARKTVEKITNPRKKEISINDIQKNRKKILVPKELEKVFDKETSAEWSKVKLPVKRKVDKKTPAPTDDKRVTAGEHERISKFAKGLSVLCELYSS